MNGNHVTFQTMSDLFDEAIPDKNERDAALSHIESCAECGLEYRRLGNMLRLCGECACLSYPLEGFALSAIRSYRTMKRRKQMLKSIPALAASILVIAGVGLFNSGAINLSGRATVADGVSRRSFSDSEQVIDIIRKNKASISEVTDQYVEGTVPASSFNELLRHLGARKVAYMLVDGKEQGAGSQWNSAMEEVGLDDGLQGVEGKQLPIGPAAGSKYVRFRVLR